MPPLEDSKEREISSNYINSELLLNTVSTIKKI